MNSTKRRFFDFLILALLGIWLIGGIPLNGKILLKHGADPRRAAMVLALLGAWLFPQFREESIVLRGVRKIGSGLLLASVRWWLLAGVTLWAALVGVLQILGLRYPMYDVGIFHQILWSLAHGHGYTSTISGAGSFLQDHLSPSLAFLVPAYWLSGSSPITLGWLSPILIFGGVAAWVYLAERLEGVSHEVRSRIAATTLVFGVTFDSLWANLRWGFHENMIGFFALSWGLALLLSEKPRKVLAFSFFLLAAGSKETLLLSVAAIFIVWIVRELKNRKASEAPFVGLLLGTTFCLIVAFVLFELMPHPADKNYFRRYYAYLGTSLGEFLKTVFFSPGRIVHEVGAGELVSYLKEVFMPWLGLPLFWVAWMLKPKKMGKVKGAVFNAFLLFTISSSFLSAALSTYSPLRQSGFHYVLELWPVLAVLTVLALGKLEQSSLGSRIKISWIWAILGVLSLGQDPWGQMREYGKDALHEREARAKFDQIPPHAALVADEMTGTWFAGRLAVTRWPDLSLLPERCPEWIVVRKNLPMTQGDTAYELSKCQMAQGRLNGLSWMPMWSTDTWIAYQLMRARP